MSISNVSATSPPVVDKSDRDKKRLKEACQEFESFLHQHLLNSMNESLLRAEEPDQARETYEAMYREQLSAELARHSNGGLADLLYRQLQPLLSPKSDG